MYDCEWISYNSIGSYGKVNSSTFPLLSVSKILAIPFTKCSFVSVRSLRGREKVYM